jgi:phosphatidylglycerol:prolipoprotein diacylglycerol transferase
MSAAVSPVYGLCVALAVACGALVAAILLRGHGVGGTRSASLLCASAVIALAGAKAFSLWERGSAAWADPRWELSFGFRYPGAIVALVVAAPALRRVLREYVTLPQLGDVLAPAVALSMSIVRVGCFVCGCCHGVPTTQPWGVQFPAGGPAWSAHVERGWIDVAAASSLVVHPLQLYFGLTSLAVGGVLVWRRRCQRWAGESFFVFLLVDGAIKLALEQLRLEYQRPLADAAAVFALVGLAGLVLGRRRSVAAASGGDDVRGRPRMRAG